MLKNIFTKIENKIFNFSQDEKNIIENYIKDEIIVKNGEDFEINSKYKIGVLKIEKNFAILEDLVNPIKNIKLIFSYTQIFCKNTISKHREKNFATILQKLQN